MYIVLTAERKKRILATKSYEEAYEFITKNTDAKTRMLDVSGKTKIIDKREFMRKFYKNTDDKNKLFDLTDLMVKGNDNIRAFLKPLGLYEDYKLYKKVMSEVL